MEVGVLSDVLPPNVRIALATGVLGGFTTFSTFGFETLSLLRDGAWALGLLNVLGSVLGCLAAGLLGVAAAGLLVRS